MGKDQIRYWEPTTGSAWMEEQYERLSSERQATCNTFPESDWMALIERNSHGEGMIQNDPETNLPHLVPYPEPTLEEKSEQAKQKRDELLSAVEWRVTRYNTQVQLDVAPTEADITPVLEYMQALRDLPENEGWPENIIWPKEP